MSNNTQYVILYDSTDPDLFGTVDLLEKISEDPPPILVPTDSVYSMNDLLKQIPSGVDVQLIINTHQDRDSSLIGTNPDFSVSYKSLYSTLPSNVTSVYNLGCHSESAVNYADYLPPGTIVYGAVGEYHSTTMYINEAFAEYGVEGRDFDAELMENGFGKPIKVKKLDRMNPHGHVKLVDSVELQVVEKEIWKEFPDAYFSALNPDDIFPDRFAVAGYGVIDLDDEMKRMFSEKLRFSEESKATVSAAFEGVALEKIETIAKKIESGESVLFNERQIALALMQQSLEESGQIQQWQNQARMSHESMAEYEFRKIVVDADNALFINGDTEAFRQKYSMITPDLLNVYMDAIMNVTNGYGYFDVLASSNPQVWREVLDIYYSTQFLDVVQDKDGNILDKAGVDDFVQKYPPDYQDIAREFLNSMINLKEAESLVKQQFMTNYSANPSILADAELPTYSNAVLPVGSVIHHL